MKRFLFAACLFLMPLTAHAVDVNEVTSPQGITAWTIKDSTLPMTVIDIVIKNAGARSDPAGKAGRASLAAHLLDEGAGPYDALAFQTQLEQYAISFDAEAAEDGLHITLRTLSKNLDKTFDLLGTALSSPHFDPEAVERIRAQTLSQIRSQEESPGYLASRALRKAMFGSYAYAHEVAGDEGSVKALSRSDLMAYTKSYFARDRLIIGAAGDVTPERLAQLIGAHLDMLPRAALAEAPQERLTLTPDTHLVSIRRDFPQSVVMFAMPGPQRQDPDFYATYLLNYLLGGASLTSRLDEEIRQKRGLAYSASSELAVYEQAGILEGAFGTRNAAVAEAAGVMDKALHKVKAKGFSEEELNNAKAYVTGSFPLQIDSDAALAGYLVTMQRFHLGKDYLSRRNSYFNSVTLEEVNAAAKKYITSEKMVTVIVGDPPQPIAQPEPF